MEKLYPHLSAVARAILGYPASSPQIGRDFGMASQPLRATRTRMDAAFVDMFLFLKPNMEKYLRGYQS